VTRGRQESGVIVQKDVSGDPGETTKAEETNPRSPLESAKEDSALRIQDSADKKAVDSEQ
jgi:hypothetical protein